MDIWQVKYVRIGDLIPNAKNPRKISKEKLERLQDKIQRLGFHNPVKTDENLNVLGGNQRLKALLKIAGKDIAVMGDKEKRIHHRVNWKFAAPLIIRESLKK